MGTGKDTGAFEFSAFAADGSFGKAVAVPYLVFV
jgi:hypothetical protein